MLAIAASVMFAAGAGLWAWRWTWPDGRAWTLRTGPDDAPFVDQHMVVGRRDVHATLAEAFSVLGQLAAKMAVLAQALEQRVASAIWTDVLNDKNGCRQILGQLA